MEIPGAEPVTELTLCVIRVGMSPTNSPFDCPCHAMNMQPTAIHGPWEIGFALDRHTISAEFLGHDPQGHPIFDTLRSEIGELLFQLKYRGNRKAAEALAEAAAEFMRSQRAVIQVVVPVPPTRVRSFQPLVDIGERLARSLGADFDARSLRKVKETEELKAVEDLARRHEALDGAFEATHRGFDGRHVLLLDDLYRSGASMSAAARAIRNPGGAPSIFALALTRTRVRS